MSIPARIIQTGTTRDLAPFARAGAINLKLLHPEWEHVYFDDNDVLRFIAEQFPEYKTAFDSFPRAIQRFDFFRYLAVYRHGGFYFDLDVFLSRPLNDLLGYDCVFPFEELTLNRYLRTSHNMDWEIGNYAFGARAGSPFLKAVIDNCVKAQRDEAWVRPMLAGIPGPFQAEFRVLNTTGPGLVTRTLAENSLLAADVTVLFPADVRDQRSWHCFGDYGVHLMKGSWRTSGGFIRRRLAVLWERRARSKVMPHSQKLGPTRQRCRSFTAPAVRSHS
jgi:hypothetical protein